eukprot:GHUV01043803.1.p1 GENE.GHUV01043803.1~~GHUV01043803.1.p1  ORF type:complete len:308 (-),score=34.80 GHUV01043803.1:223-1146(-)
MGAFSFAAVLCEAPHKQPSGSRSTSLPPRATISAISCCKHLTRPASPCCCIFYAEPTSGLDSLTANEVMRVVSSLARDGTTIATTIHSPSSYCFSLFDKLLILMSGKPVYFGEPGSAAISYFTGSCGARQPRVGDNLAEWMLETVTQADRSECKASLSRTYRESTLAQVCMHLQESPGVQSWKLLRCMHHLCYVLHIRRRFCWLESSHFHCRREKSYVADAGCGSQANVAQMLALLEDQKRRQTRSPTLQDLQQLSAADRQQAVLTDCGPSTAYRGCACSSSSSYGGLFDCSSYVTPAWWSLKVNVG